MTETKLEPKPRGRPRVDDPKAVISTRVATGEYDRLVRIANRRDQSLSALVRDMIRISSRKPSGI